MAEVNERTGGRVMVVEDAEAIRAAVEAGLVTAGHLVLSRPDGRDFEQALSEFQPDVVVLDVMLPGRDGFALLDAVRTRTDAGVVMLTARDGIDDRLRGLTRGADDYVIKPFVLEELVARVEALLRRLGRVQSTIAVGDMVIDPDAASVHRGASRMALTATEYKILVFLARHRGKVLTKTQILSAVWGFDAYDDNLVEVHVSSLRRKLDQHGPRLLRACYLAAHIAIRTDTASRIYYDRKRAQGKRHSQAVLALARRLNVMWAMLRDHKPYQPTASNAAAA